MGRGQPGGAPAAVAAAWPRWVAAARRVAAVADRWLLWLLTALTAVLLAGVVLLVVYQVYLRYFLRHSPRWTEEIALLLMVWLAMVGAALVHRHREHVAVELVVQALPAGARRGVGRLVELLVLAFGVFMVLEGWRLTRASMSQVLAGSQLPIGYLYLGIPIGGLALSAIALAQLVGLLPPPPGEPGEEKGEGGVGERH